MAFKRKAVEREKHLTTQRIEDMERNLRGQVQDKAVTEDKLVSINKRIDYLTKEKQAKSIVLSQIQEIQGEKMVARAALDKFDSELPRMQQMQNSVSFNYRLP